MPPDEEAPPPEPQVTVAAPAPRQTDDFLEIAKSHTYIAAEPSFLRRFYQYWEDVDRKDLIKLYDHPTDSRCRAQLIAHYANMVYSLGGLLVRKNDLIVSELDAWFEEVRNEDSFVMVNHLTSKVTELLEQLGLGIPPKSADSEWERLEDDQEAVLKFIPRRVAPKELLTK